MSWERKGEQLRRTGDADDELLTPTLQGTDDGVWYRRPWRVTSQFWVGFFGGVLALGLIAWLNSDMLKVEPLRRRWILVSTAAAFVLVLGIAAAVGYWDVGGEVSAQRRYLRLAVKGVAVGLYLIVAGLQRTAERRYVAYGEGEYASLWGWGIGTTIGLGTVQGIIVAMVWNAVRTGGF